MSPPDKLKESKVRCTICSKELTKQYMKKHMDKVHMDKDRLKAAAVNKGGLFIIKDLMSDIIALKQLQRLWIRTR